MDLPRFINIAKLNCVKISRFIVSYNNTAEALGPDLTYAAIYKYKLTAKVEYHHSQYSKKNIFKFT